MKKTSIVVCLAFAALSCSHKKEEIVEQMPQTNLLTLTDGQLKNAAIEVGQLQNEGVASRLRVSGKIDVPPQNMVSISFPMGGYLKNTQLLPGMHLKKGQIIATIEDIQFIQLQQDYLAAKVSLQLLNTQLVRQQTLFDEKVIAAADLQPVQAEHEHQQIIVKALQAKMELAGILPATVTAQNIIKTVNIFSPIDGFVSKVNVNIGKYVTPSDVLFELVNPTDIHLNLKIFEKDVAKLRIGQKLICYTNTEPSKKHPCEIILISKDISPDHTAEVHCHFLDYDKNLLPGTYMNAEIEVENKISSVLPEDAVISFGGKEFVFISVASQQFEMVEVQTGATENGRIEIKNSTQLANKNIVVQNAYTLLMSLKNKAEE